MTESQTEKIAMVYLFSNPKSQFLGDKLIKFEPKRNISLAWVDLDDVQRLLDVRDPFRCCGGSKKPIYRIASEQEIEIWSLS